MKYQYQNIILILIALFSVDACASEISKIMKIKQQFSQPQQNVMVVAHRACWRLAPENSVLAVKKCIGMGVDMVEIDVQRSKDGHLVVIHDKTLNRTTNGKGKVSDHTLAELKNLFLKQHNGGEDVALTTEKIPTLKEVLLTAKNQIMVNIDAKGDIRKPAFIEAQQLNMLDHILIKDRLTAPTKELQQAFYYGKTNFMPIIKEKDGDLAVIVNRFNQQPQSAYEVIFDSEQGLKSACYAAYKQGARCWVNTLWESLSPGYSDDRNIEQPEQHWGVLIKQFGVDIIQTDRPQLLIQYLSEQKKSERAKSN